MSDGIHFMSREEFDRLWESGEQDKIWSREKAIEALEKMTKFGSGNRLTRAAARRELEQVRADAPDGASRV
ncbi:hypothetical protein [Burkholderia pseudomultivorans]|uniref:hypothetical protein n=1 Tax=Burkholderia pseudomultivorans TaxID=1207504 RepID=UPI0008418F6E|nr:hypothetical protein [Burkholderia pseudomultivorans]AOI92778.1 hypothetical protein WS57_29450 [Burkholderia pseudomultivorans]